MHDRPQSLSQRQSPRVPRSVHPRICRQEYSASSQGSLSFGLVPFPIYKGAELTGLIAYLNDNNQGGFGLSANLFAATARDGDVCQ